jgi:hypothetical protein
MAPEIRAGFVGNDCQDDSRFNHRKNRARYSCCIPTNFTPIPSLGSLLCTTAVARTSPAGKSSSNWMKVPGAGGSGVRMYNPPSPALSTAETTLLWAVCQAKIVSFGHARRG